MAVRSKSSKAWLHEHVNDHYVHMAQKDGYRARAAYKLLEINQKDKLIKLGTVLADLGSAPGSWSQVAASWSVKQEQCLLWIFCRWMLLKVCRLFRATLGKMLF